MPLWPTHHAQHSINIDTIPLESKLDCLDAVDRNRWFLQEMLQVLSAKGRSLQRAAIEYDLATQITDLLVLPESEDLVVRFGGEGEQR
jgi:hypothetical protein